MSRYNYDATNLHPGGLQRLTLNTATGMQQHDFFMDPADIANASAIAAYKATRTQVAEVVDRHVAQIESAPSVHVFTSMNSTRFLIGTEVDVMGWIGQGEKVDSQFSSSLFPGCDTFDNVMAPWIDNGTFDVTKFITSDNPIEDLFTSVGDDYFDRPVEERVPIGTISDVYGSLTTSEETVSYTHFAHYLNTTGNWAKHWIGSWPKPGSAIPGVLGIRLIAMKATGLEGTSPRVEITPWAGWEVYVTALASRFTNVFVTGTTVHSTITPDFSTSPGYIALNAAFTKITPSNSGYNYMWGKFTAAMSWVGRPFGSGTGIIVGDTSSLGARSGPLNDYTTACTGSLYYATTFANLALANRNVAAVETDTAKSANLIAAAEKLELKPANLVAAVLLQAAMALPDNEMHTTKLWTDVTAAGKNLGAEMFGTETLGSMITRLNGMQTFNSLTAVIVEELVVEATVLLSVMRNAADYQVNVTTSTGPVYAFELYQAGLLVPNSSWFTEGPAASLFLGGASLTTTDASDLTAVATYLNTLIGGTVDLSSPEYILAPDAFCYAGMPLYHPWLTSTDYKARAHLILKGLEQDSVRQQMIAMSEVLKATLA